MIEAIARHIRHGGRLLVRAPLFAATAILSLAIGLGANTAIFTVANALLFAPTKHIREMDTLVDIGRTTGGQGFDTVSFATYADLHDRNTVFDGVYALREPQPLSLGGDDGADRVYGEQVSASYFDVLGLVPAAGGFFHPMSCRFLGSPEKTLLHSDHDPVCGTARRSASSQIVSCRSAGNWRGAPPYVSYAGRKRRM
jgi:MacB-like periplasmic core domain